MIQVVTAVRRVLVQCLFPKCVIGCTQFNVLFYLVGCGMSVKPLSNDEIPYYSHQTRFMTLLDTLADVDRKPESRSFAAEAVKMLIAQTDHAWDVLLDKYAAARTALLK